MNATFFSEEKERKKSTQASVMCRMSNPFSGIVLLIEKYYKWKYFDQTPSCICSICKILGSHSLYIYIDIAIYLYERNKEMKKKHEKVSFQFLLGKIIHKSYKFDKKPPLLAQVAGKWNRSHICSNLCHTEGKTLYLFCGQWLIIKQIQLTRPLS